MMRRFLVQLFPDMVSHCHIEDSFAKQYNNMNDLFRSTIFYIQVKFMAVEAPRFLDYSR